MTSEDVARRYFDALAAADLDAAIACWAPGGTERIVGQRELTAPHEIRTFLNGWRDAFPDLTWEVLEVIASDEQDRVAVRWRATGTFAGPGRFPGLQPNAARLDLEGCDVLTVSVGGTIEHLDAYLDSGDLARQLGVLPRAESPAATRLTQLVNARTRVRRWVAGGEAQRIAEGVWLVRGGVPKTMNVYLIEDDGGVTVYDAGTADMTGQIAAAAARLGGINRVVLGHADADHRGAAPGLGAPVYCHPGDRAAAESSDSYRDYWDRSKLDPQGRAVLWRLIDRWDGGPVAVAGTVEEGDDVAGFKVIHLPGHAPGLIALLRESDRLALVSDAFYTLDPQSGRRQPAHVPHPAFNQDTEQARAAIRKLATLHPSAAWPGHAEPVTGDVDGQLDRAASG